MPLYDFYDTEKDIHFEKQLKIAEVEDYLKQNPHIRKEFVGAPAAIDPVRLGIRKPDSGFKEVLKQIHSRTPGSMLNKTAL